MDGRTDWLTVWLNDGDTGEDRQITGQWKKICQTNVPFLKIKSVILRSNSMVNSEWFIVTNDTPPSWLEVTKSIHADTWLHAANKLYFMYKKFCPCCVFVHIPVATSMIPFLFEQIVEDAIKEGQMWYRFLTQNRKKKKKRIWMILKKRKSN